MGLIQPGAKGVSNALDFDGISHFVSIPNGTGIFANLNAFSMCGWVYPTNPNTAWPDFDGYFGIKNEGVCDFYIVQLYSSQLEVRITTNQGQFTIPWTSLSQVTMNEWQHFAVVYTGSELQLFYNGQLDGSVAATGVIPYNFYEVTIGKLEYFDTDFFLDGKVDEVTFWDKALTADEIVQFQCISGDPSAVPNLVAYYNFNETEGMVLPDFFGSHDGYLTNMAGTEWVESEVCLSGYDILFIVTDQLTNEPVANAGINLAGIIKYTDSNGEATFTNYEPGNYPYEVTKPDYYTSSGEVVVVDENVTETVLLAPIVFYDITYHVTEDPGGIPIDSAIVNMSGTIQFTDETGQTTFTGFLPGTYPYTVLKPGYFFVQGEVEVVDEDVTVEVSLLIDRIAGSSAQDFKVYPNPAGNTLNIQPAAANIFFEVCLRDITGKTARVSQFVGEKQTRLDLSEVPRGVYFLEIRTGTGVHTVRVIRL